MMVLRNASSASSSRPRWKSAIATRKCGRRGRIVLDGPARGGHAFRHRAAAVVAERQMEVRRRVRLVQLDHALEGALRVARLPEMVEGEAEVEVRVRIVRVRLD